VAGNDGGAAQTATGVQLVQAAAGMRIQAYTRRMELELIKPQASQWLALNQQRWASARSGAGDAAPGEPERRWAWRKIGPGQQAGEFDVEPEGGATAPDNVPQDRQDAQMIMQAAGQIPGVDPHQVGLLVLKKLGVPAPETLMAPPQQVPPETLDILKQQMLQAGMDPAGVQGLIEGALNQALDAREQQAQAAAREPQAAPVDGQAPPEQAAA
jgi:hypothetical protein